MGNGSSLSAWLLGALLGVGALAGVPGSVVAAAATPAVRAAGPLPTPQFRRYETTNGLPSGAVYAVAQDRHGLLWFGSAGGLVCFDGVDFSVFRHVVGDPQSLPANQTYALFVDRDNRIWAGGVSTGLVSYDQASGRFRHWQHDDQPDSLADDEVWSIAQTADGQLWVATQGGLDRLRADGRGFDHVALEVDGHREPFGATRALLAEADGRLWIGAHSGLYLRLPDGTIRRVPVDPAFHGELGKVWRIDGGDGEVRVALEGGLLVIGADGVARPLAFPQLASLRILGSARDAQGRLWMGSLNGVWMDDGSGRLQHIVGQPLLPGGLPGDRLWQLLRDREGGLWFTFDQSSIAYLPPGWSGFTRFTHVPDDPRSLSDIAALSVRRSRDRRLWVGGFNGWVDKLDPATGEVEHVLKGLRGNLASLAEDTRGRLWIAGPGELYRYDRGKLVTIEAKRSHVSRPTALVAGDDGRVYVSSWGQGVFALDPVRMTGSSLMPADAPDNTRFHDQLSFHAGRLWYASAGGLLRGDGPDRRLAFVPGVPHHEILAFAFDAGGLWTATSEALEHYREVDGRAERDASVDISRQPFAADLMAIEVDRQGRLWLFANPGLWRFEPTTKQFTAFGPSQGLSSSEFTNGSVELAPDGTLFAASSGGVMAFRPERLAQLQQSGAALPLPLTLTAVTVRRDHRLQPLAPGQPVRLQWRDRDLHVEARLASFVDPAANRYRFRLQGFDNGWVDVGSRGEREFAGLGAGDYTLGVMAAGADGEWSTLATPLHIHVQAPPWRRWWAWAIYVLLVAALAALILRGWRRRLAQRHRMQLVEQQRQLAEAASAAKTQFLATLSHEIRTPMTGVMGMAELLLSTPLNRQQHDYTQAMQRSGGMLLKLLNDALDLARIEAGRLELEPVPFEPRQLLEDVAQLEQGLAHAKGIRFVLELAEDLPAQLLGDAVRIKQILLNLANNALKFTEHGSVTLSARRLPDGLQLSVSDTGPGIPEASQARLFQRFEQADSPQRRAGSGLGLAICRELVEMMGGSIELESRLGHGSTFRVRLPLAEPAAAPAPVELPSGRRYRLLLVEDDTIVAAVIRGLLEREGHVVVHVVNGLAALAELAHAQFDAVLLDLDLPGVDGFQVARLIRQRERAGQHLPIVAVTARSGGEDEAKARAAGMDGFLHKPLSGEQLAAALARVIVAGDPPA